MDVTLPVLPKIIPIVFLALFLAVNPIGTALFLSGNDQGGASSSLENNLVENCDLFVLGVGVFFSLWLFSSKTFWHYNPNRASVGRLGHGSYGMA